MPYDRATVHRPGTERPRGRLGTSTGRSWQGGLAALLVTAAVLAGCSATTPTVTVAAAQGAPSSAQAPAPSRVAPLPPALTALVPAPEPPSTLPVPAAPVAVAPVVTPAPLTDPQPGPSAPEPARLRPRAGEAARDLPRVMGAACHNHGDSPARTCSYGDPAGLHTVLVLGDSHLVSWFPALDEVTRRRGWRLLWLSMSACPWADVTARRGDGPYTACDRWRASALAVARAVPSVDLALVTSSHRPTLMARDTLQDIADPAAAAQEWARGAARTVAALRAVAPQVVILRDTPRMRADVPTCLRHHPRASAGCATPSPLAVPDPRWEAETALAAQVGGVATVDLDSLLCDAGSCPAVSADGTVRWRDAHHLTATFARTLAPRVEAALAAYLP